MLAIFLIILFAFAPAILCFAVEFDGGYVISDSDMFDYQSMSLSDIQDFLKKKNGTLDDYIAPDKNNAMKSAAEIVWNASQEYKINPKFILVMIQKEQSVVEDDLPKATQYDWAAGYGVCDSCDLNDPALLVYKGFGTQIDRLAGSQRWYVEHKNDAWLKQAGKSYVIDGQNVLISNQATANLYNYTPHIKGNYLYWQIWNRWFTQTYPDSSLLQAQGEPGIWLIQNGQRRPFFSKGAFLSRYDFASVVVVSKNELNKYEIGAPIKFPNYSLLQSPLDEVFLLDNDKLRPFESKEVWKTLGFNPEEFEDISFDEFSKYELGEAITLSSAYPTGALLQDRKTGGVFFVQNGNKYPLITKDILKINYPKYKIIPVTFSELEKYPRIDSVKLKDGVLARTPESPAVYAISNGQKRPILSGEVFDKLGYKWENVKVVEEKSLSNLALGEFVELDFKK